MRLLSSESGDFSDGQVLCQTDGGGFPPPVPPSVFPFTSFALWSSIIGHSIGCSWSFALLSGWFTTAFLACSGLFLQWFSDRLCPPCCSGRYCPAHLPGIDGSGSAFGLAHLSPGFRFPFPRVFQGIQQAGLSILRAPVRSVQSMDGRCAWYAAICTDSPLWNIRRCAVWSPALSAWLCLKLYG